MCIMWIDSQIRTSVGNLERVPTSVTTPRDPTSAAATSISPESMRLARLMVRTPTLWRLLAFQAYFCVLFVSLVYHFYSLRPAAPRQVLYIADDNEIRSLDPSIPNWRYEQIFQGDANVRIDAMDLHVKTNRIYWTNWHTGRISSYDLPSSSSSPNSNRNRRQSDSRVTNVEVCVHMCTSIYACM